MLLELNKHFWESFVLGIQKSKKMEENELIAFWHSYTWIHRFFFFFHLVKHLRGSSIIDWEMGFFWVCVSISPFVLFFPHLCTGAYLRNKDVNCFWLNSPHTCSSYIDITLICVAGNCRLHLFSHRQAFNKQYPALFLSFIWRLQFYFLLCLSLFLSLFLLLLPSSHQITAATHLQVGLVSVWYLSHILPLLQHSHRLSSARTETSLHDSLILLFGISSTGNNPATPTAIQERWQHRSLSHHQSLDSHDLGRPSATAQTRDQLTARWLDLTIWRAGGLSAEVSLPLPLQHRLCWTSFCSALVSWSQVAVTSD